MNDKIDLMLFDDNKLVFSRNDVAATIKQNEYIIYQTEDEYNKYDYKKNIYIRKTNEMTMELNFLEKKCKFIFENEGVCEIDISCSYLITVDEITLNYNIDESSKIIKIKRKN